MGTSTPNTGAGKGASFSMSRRIAAAKTRAIQTVLNFVEGYRNREDTSLLKPQQLVAGSHDVLVGTTGRIRGREGYYLYGAMSTAVAVTRPLPDWEMGTGYVHHLRAGGNTTGSNGQLQLSYVDTYGAITATGGVVWLPLLTGLTSTYFQSTNYWDTTAVKAKNLFVNRTGNIWEWTGGIATIASVGSSSVVVNGTPTLAQLKFDASGSFINNGNTYTYGSIASGTFLNVSPTASAAVINSPVYQAPVQSTFSNFTFTNTPAPAAGFTLDVIGVLQSSNQVFLASTQNNIVYMSKAGTYKDYSQSTARLQYEGDLFYSIGSVNAIQPQESEMYISAGLNEWYTTDFTQTVISNSTTGTTQTFEVAKLSQLKTTAGQAAISQYATTKIANDVAMITFEPRVDSLGRVTGVLATPQITNLSYPIIMDMNAYNFTDASLFYFKERLYVAIPSNGVVIIYNMTEPKHPFWEAPQNLPVSGFCAVGNTLIGHSYNTFESYVMFSGYSDRAKDANSTGNPINSVAYFPMQELGLRAKSKSMNKFFIEGYMSKPTILNIGLIYRMPGDGASIGTNMTVNGTDAQVLTGVMDNSLGKVSLGKNPIGGDIQNPQQQNLPPYFAVIKTFPKNPYFAYQPVFYSLGTNQRWELLSYGNNASPTSEGENTNTV